MWAFRRMQRIPWMARMTNEAVLKQTGKERSLMRNITKRQLEFLGHTIRKRKLEHLAITGKIEGKRAPGRQRTTFLQQFKQKGTELLHKAYVRLSWKTVIKEAINVWNRYDT